MKIARKNKLIHEADQQSQPLVITIFTHVACPSFTTFQNLNNFQEKIVIATGGIVGLAEWIIDYNNILLFLESWSDSYTHSCSGAAQWTELHTLQPASLYHIRLFAVNAIGNSGFTHPPLVVATSEEVPEGPPLEVRGHEDGPRALVIQWKVW